MTKRKLTWIVMVAILAAGMVTAAPKPKKGKQITLPAVWKAAPTQERLKALRVAELDALRQLAERIYGQQLSSGSTVYDFVLASDRVSNSVQVVIKGAVPLEKAEYTDDGIVQVVYGVNMRKVIEVIKHEVKRDSSGKFKDITTKSIENEDRVIDALGNGALSGSKGMAMIRAKRAAEMDGYRKMAERMMGVKINGETTVAQFALENDRIRGSVTAFLRGIKPVDITYMDDSSCEVVMQLKKRQVIETVETIVTHYRKSFRTKTETIEKVNQDINDQTFTVTGNGSPSAAKDTAPRSSQAAVDPAEAYKEEIKVIRRVIEEKVVVD